MKNKIFISHSSKDILIVEKFVEKILILGLKISPDRIFCSSMEGQGVKSGEYIPDRLKEEINKSTLALLFISKNYKESEVCINEIGAAWAVLEKENVIPLIFPNIGFEKLGFLNLNTLGLKIEKEESILKLIEDCKDVLDTDYKPTVLNKQIKSFLLEFLTPTVSEESKKEMTEWERCFEHNLYAFDDVLRKSLPTKSDGIHEIILKKNQDKILSNLSKTNFLDHLWYRHSGGDYYVEHITQIPNKNWIISGFNWEIKISSLWVSMNSELSYEFILIRSDIQEPYEIQSDIKGKGFRIGVLPDGTTVSETERENGYAEINGGTIDLFKAGVKPRKRDEKAKWVFLISDYHKLGVNANKTIEFCEKLDSGEIKVSEENIMNFLYPLQNHGIVNEYR